MPKDNKVINVIANVFYETIDPRRKQERIDSRTVSSDQNSMANLSNEPVYKEWQKNLVYESPYVDPGIFDPNRI